MVEKETLLRVQSRYRIHVSNTQLEIENVEVLDDPFLLGLWDDDSSHLMGSFSPGSSAAHSSFQVFGIACTLYGNLRGSVINLS